MNILLCVPFEINAPKGNSVAARRLDAGFRKNGHRTAVIDPPGIHDLGTVQQVAVDFQPDVILVLHAWRCAKAVMAIREVHPAPFIVSLRGTDLNEMLDAPETKDDLSRILDLAAGIAVFHQNGKKRLATYHRSWVQKTRVIPNGLELCDSAIDYRNRLGISPTAFVFVAVGGLREVKRPFFAVPVLARLRRTFPQIVWLHAGPTQEQESAEELKKIFNLYKNEGWLFHEESVPHEEIASFLRAGDVFVAASRSEGMPHSVREAMLAGVPLLLSDIDGHRNMATPETEALFFQDERDCQYQAGRLLENSDLRSTLARNSRERLKKDLLHGNEISSYLEFLQHVMSGKSCTTNRKGTIDE